MKKAEYYQELTDTLDLIDEALREPVICQDKQLEAALSTAREALAARDTFSDPAHTFAEAVGSFTRTHDYQVPEVLTRLLTILPQ